MTSSFTSAMSHSIVAAVLLTMLLAPSGMFWDGGRLPYKTESPNLNFGSARQMERPPAAAFMRATDAV